MRGEWWQLMRPFCPCHGLTTIRVKAMRVTESSLFRAVGLSIVKIPGSRIPAVPKNCLYLQLWRYFSLLLYWIIFPFRDVRFPLARLGPPNPFTVRNYGRPLPQNIPCLVLFIPKYGSTAFSRHVGTHLQDYKRVPWPVWPQYVTPLLVMYFLTYLFHGAESFLRS